MWSDLVLIQKSFLKVLDKICLYLTPVPWNSLFKNMSGTISLFASPTAIPTFKKWSWNAPLCIQSITGPSSAPGCYTGWSKRTRDMPRKSFQQDLWAHHPRSSLFKSVVYQWGTTLHTHENYSSFKRIQNYIAFKKLLVVKLHNYIALTFLTLLNFA